MNPETIIYHKKATTPKTINTYILKFCKQLIKTDQKPQYILVTSDPLAEKDECFQNVVIKRNRDGGNVQHGWIIWHENKKNLLIAEFHALWVNLEGDWVDITPHKEERILFLPDPVREASPEYKPQNEFMVIPEVQPITAKKKRKKRPSKKKTCKRK